MSKFKIETYKKLQHEIIFNGIQTDREGRAYGYMFTDRLTGSSFLLKNTETGYEQIILNRLQKIRKRYEEAKCN